MIGRYGESYVRTFPTTPGARTYVATSADATTLRVYVDTSTVEICLP
jgi:hypothetical protein